MSSIRYVLSMQILFITFSLSSCRSDYSLIYEHTQKKHKFCEGPSWIGFGTTFSRDPFKEYSSQVLFYAS
jgi:hypothetical protein